MVMRGSFKLIKAMLDEFTGKKITVMGDDYKKTLLEHIDANSLEARFGGNIPDKTDKFFPPDMSQGEEPMLTIDEAKARLGAPWTEE